VQTFYQLLSVEPTATAEEIKRAFRTEIARYHPDKVQHLGKEFQDMAAGRAAALTEAYRTLTNPELRSAYDRLHGAPRAAPPPPEPASQPGARSRFVPPHPTHSGPSSEPASSARFATERATSDEFVRKATLERLRIVLMTEYDEISESLTRGFDFDCTAKSKKMFGRAAAQRFAAKFVARVDRAQIQDAWVAAQKAGGQICVFVMGSGLATMRELAETIAEMRKRSRVETGISLVPVDLRDWTAHIPTGSPEVCKAVLQKLREPGRF